MEEEEINLMDYVKVVIKRGRMILAMAIGIAIVIFLISFFSPKIYELSTVIEIGRFGRGADLIEPAVQVQNKIEAGAYETMGLKANNPAGTNLVIIKMESANIEQAKNDLEKTVQLILNNHQKIIESQKKITELQKDILEKNIDRLNNRIPFLENEKKTIENTFTPLTKLALAQQPAIFQISYLKTQETLESKIKEIEDARSQILNLENSILNLESSIELIQPTKVVKSPSVLGPVGQKILFNTFVALILGLFVGLVTAFFLDWWAKNR